VQSDEIVFQLPAGIPLRQVTYQVENLDGSASANIPISELYTDTAWTCTNAVEPPVTTTQCDSENYTDDNGQFIDYWSMLESSIPYQIEPANCGSTVVDHWQWCSINPGGPPYPGMTFMTLNGADNWASTTINGYENPPDAIPAGFAIGP
jgi:hypothetical protein